MRRLFWIMAAAVLCCAPVTALAQTKTFNISGTFTAPATGTYSGSYSVDPGANTIVSANIQVTAGKSDDGVSDLSAVIFTHNLFETANAFFLTTSSFGTGSPLISIHIDGGKSTPSGTSSITEVLCADADCQSVSFQATHHRVGAGTTTAAAASIPTLSQWTMILLGLALAGGAALYIQRRRLA